uniref:very-long-chain (3R)-3-hydroxyacyl-CoA dehydratase 4 n=1 Tax=Lonchura striata TaxID=40157 RepID=UPI001293B2E9|nr:very-long-chain (3R)-3-hydroxyacyl-CoA dehydratase 4 [Lonchura striata domestica]
MSMYLFVYDLMQFCGHSWIFTNMIIRFMTFGKDSLADTFHSIGLVMRLCQLLSVLEILHILIGIDKSRLLPRFLQITERIIILFVVINSQEEVQGKYVVCVLFFLWNLLDVVRYTYNMLARMGIYYLPLTWLNFSLCIVLYPLSVLAKGKELGKVSATCFLNIKCDHFNCRFAICVSLPYFESFGTYSIKLPFPFTFSIYFPYVLKMYLLVLFAGMCFIIRNLFSERMAHLGTDNIKNKRS